MLPFDGMVTSAIMIAGHHPTLPMAPGGTPDGTVQAAPGSFTNVAF